MPPAAPAATNSQQALQNLQSFQGSMQKPSDILASQEQQYGVPAAQQNVSGLRQAITNTTNLLNQIPSSIYGRTGNSLVTNAQATRQIGNESAPVQQTLSKQGTDLQTASGDLNTALSRSQAGANLDITGQQNKLQGLQGIYDNFFKQEQAQQAQNLEKQKLAEQVREANMSNSTKLATSSGSSVNPAAGYNVKQLSSGNKAYTGPNGQTNLYQYASALAGGDPQGTYNIIKQQLATGSATDKGAYNGILKLEKQGLPIDQIIGRLKASNGYIFS